MSDLPTLLAECTTVVDEIMDVILLSQTKDTEMRLFEAMRYSYTTGGKRLRPFLVTHSSALFSVDQRCAARVAAAVEFMHTYSLIHDDLPAMDNADIRRGKPSCHRQFDEATAILAGDALQALAFEVLTAPETHVDPAVRVELVRGLSQAAGVNGMCGGQMIDLLAERTGELNISKITRLQHLKTSKMFAFSSVAGSILGKGSHRSYMALHNFAQDFGLAFQIADDLLDVEGDRKKLCNSVGQNVVDGKATFVSVLGVERTRAHVSLLVDNAITQLEVFDEVADPLREAAHYFTNSIN
ncbi:polyprenyl synthetase family protein [Candidatus Endolissoclinum faulkneri L2]|uniref:Polyprenyl synthetase family protein n=1 Tax=Candidatus Endolissoclinum faulkneri L2 TaxID=1193729 RepID=K7ZD79_9PROT|nr:farnesyl diphosphate synthase [Candidatus Endolissoclinum faulkneri]AFX99276.1 polyprenyl synthetase family protein [Candidatus Endolissoclinum faulkneri L2]